jgi:polysaccharide export outer membrane protein
MKKSLYLFLVIIILFSSCASRKKTLYLQETNADTTQVYSNVDSTYKLQVGDILYIRVLSLNKEINDVFNLNSSTNTYNMYNNESSLYVNGYSISDSGTVSLPILGDIKLEGKTVYEARREVQRILNEYIKDGIADVKLISYRFTVLGEVHRPGVYVNYSDKLNIFEAIGKAGDINEFGNKTNVVIVRPTPTGSETYKFDITDNSILTSNYYYVKPNDIIYIEPLKYRAWKLNTLNVTLFLTSVSTLILVLNFIK